MSPIDNQTGNRHDSATVDTEDYVAKIVNSQSNKKVVAAGAGTGKTTLFEEVIKDVGRKANSHNGKVLVISFLRALVEDLEKDLDKYPYVEVSTLHSFAQSTLSKSIDQKIDIFRELPEIMDKDIGILRGRQYGKTEALFRQMNIRGDLLAFYRGRRDYYGTYYGFQDVVFELVEHLTKNKSDIPLYGQICIDEYQDFNKSEVGLIKLLEERNRMLIAGDDDQALYGFRGASSRYIREIHHSDCEEYESFSLPYCYRCTEVIVSAANDIIEKATQRGWLEDRICKEYTYFKSEKKDKISNRNSKIVYTQLNKNQIGNFVEKQLEEIKLNDYSDEAWSKCSVLIISPTNELCEKIATDLKDIGFTNIELKKKEENSQLDKGLEILLQNNECNLGWRVVAEEHLSTEDLKEAILKSHFNDSIKFKDCLDDDTIAKVKEDLENKRIAKEEPICTLSPEPELSDDLKSKKIAVSTFERSKGCSADYVFIAQFYTESTQYYKNSITDAVICKFVVALTRAKRKVFLLSEFFKEDPILLNWIDSNKIQKTNWQN